MKNIADISLSMLLFWAVGFGIMYGSSYGGLIGSDNFFFDSDNADPATTLNFLFQAMFCGTAITILSGAIAERVRFSAYLYITVVIAVLVYPVVGHWVWGGADSEVQGWLAKIGFVDFAGATVVHSVGGWAALALLVLIGPRAYRFNADGTPNKVQPSSLPLAMLGVLILWFGWIGFNGGSAGAFDENVPRIIINTTLSACAGLCVALLLDHYVNGYFSPFSAINGVLAGLVASTAGANVLSAGASIFIGSTGAILALTVDRFLLKRQIDDAVSAVPIHLAAGLWGTVAIAIFAPAEALGTGLSMGQQITVQLAGSLVCGIWAFSVTYIVCWSIDQIHPLRADISEEQDGLNVAEHKATSELLDLVAVMDQHSRSKDLSLRAHAEPFTETGQIASYYNHTMDALEKSAHELEASKKRYESIASCSPVGIFNLDAEGNCQFVNPAWCDIFQTTAEDFSNQNWSTFDSEDQRKKLLQQLALRIAEGHNIEEEIQFPGQDGDERFVHIQAVSEFDNSAHRIGCVGTVTDITQRRQMESLLRNSQKMESVGKMAAGIAHEINSPLQFVGTNTAFVQEAFRDFLTLQKLYTQLIAELRSGKQTDSLMAEIEELCNEYDIEFLTDEVPCAIEQTIDGIDRVARIVSAMREFAHPGKSEMAAIDLNHAIENVIVMTKNEWKLHANVSTDLATDLPAVQCVESELHQVLTILIVNAAQAIDEQLKASGAANDERGDISIATALHSQQVSIRIQDSGTGIPEELRDKVFDLFFTTKEVGSGSGQGLSIAYNIIVNKHQGKIDIESEPGQGTCFVITLPLEQQETEQVA
jgi:Amt family ammonium transporter